MKKGKQQKVILDVLAIGNSAGTGIHGVKARGYLMSLLLLAAILIPGTLLKAHMMTVPVVYSQ